jgi:ATP-dependent Clp protease, protease subunit
MAYEDFNMLHVWNVRENLLKYRHIKIYNPIENDIAEYVNSCIDVLANDDAVSPITIELDTPGGSVFDGFAIVDKMRTVKCPIIVRVMGWAASFGTIISASADRAYVSENSTIIIHQLQQTLGNRQLSEPDLERIIKENQKLNDRLLGLLSKKTGLSIDELKAKTDHDWYLTAKEAYDLGLYDGIIADAKTDDESKANIDKTMADYEKNSGIAKPEKHASTATASVVKNDASVTPKTATKTITKTPTKKK